MESTEMLTILAIITGPIAAVLITRYLDDRRERHRNRMEVFKTLMRTRRMPVSLEHVGALNLIEIEFARDHDVLENWKKLFEHFGTQHNRRSDEEINNIKQSEIGERNKRFHSRLAQERQKLLSKLLHAMAKTMKFKIEQLEIFDGGYVPQGWEDEFTEQMIARKFIVDVALARRLLPIGVYDYTQMSDSSAPDEQSENDPISP